MRERLKQLLVKHEGLRLKAYTDTVGKVSIGVGRNLDDTGITKSEAMALLENDIARCEQEARRYLSWYDDLDSVRQDVILSLIFNMGIQRLKTFKNMIQGIQQKNFGYAASELLDSKWSDQVREIRSADLASMLSRGEYI